jgi:hypothetical protein
LLLTPPQKKKKKKHTKIHIWKEGKESMPYCH